MKRYPPIILFLGLLVLAVLAGCAVFRSSPPRGGVETYTSPDGRTIYFPRQAYTEVFLEAGMHFRLLLDDHGCLRSQDGQLILWRAGFTLRMEGDKAEVLDDHGQLVARVGDRMNGGGGEVPFTVIPGLPLEDCPTEYYWQLGAIKPLNPSTP